MSILEIKNLTVVNKSSKQLLLDNISFTLDKGQILGIVGESGSGKTLTGLSILNLLFLLTFRADTATIFIFLPVLISMSFFLVLSSFNK